MCSATVVVEPSQSYAKKDGVRGAAVLERQRRGGAGIIRARDIGGRAVAAGGVRIRPSAMDPLTPTTSRTWGPLLAPADEGAGCDPLSPPRERGPRNSEIERPTNVETPRRIDPYGVDYLWNFYISDVVSPLRPHHSPSPEAQSGRSTFRQRTVGTSYGVQTGVLRTTGIRAAAGGTVNRVMVRVAGSD